MLSSAKDYGRVDVCGWVVGVCGTTIAPLASEDLGLHPMKNQIDLDYTR